VVIFRNREKTLNAILYFTGIMSEKSRDAIFNMLYLFDAAHYAATGRSSTNMHYYAWKNGPVPGELLEEVDNLSDYFSDSLDLAISLRNDHKFDVSFVPLRAFDSLYFSKRELSILMELGDRYLLSPASDIKSVVCEAGGFWDQTYNRPHSGTVDGEIEAEKYKYSVISFEPKVQ
jgi:hypothetical protein